VDARREVEEARRAVAEIRERADYLRFKAEEIEAAELRSDEEETLGAEALRLEHSGELLALSGSLYDAVYASEESVVDRLGVLRRALDELTTIDPGAGELECLFDTARHSLEEAGRELQKYHEGVSHDPGRLETLRQRQDLLFRLKSKYDGSIPDVIAAGSEARAELDRLESGKFEIDGLEEARVAAEDELVAIAEELSAARNRAARRLGKRVSSALPDLGMSAGRFEVVLEPLEHTGPTGAERAEYRVRLNAGFEPQPLARVASGGELSRVMLALKTELAAVDHIPSLVFDEIDAGIGGQIAHQVADRLAEVANKHQVFAITHLPQIAARATTHWRVDKATSGGTSAARLERLDGEARVQEVARMLGGDPDSGLSRRHAEEMLAQVGQARRARRGSPETAG
jgi:DNA repair protein RecN (Recombination protein N)